MLDPYVLISSIQHTNYPTMNLNKICDKERVTPWVQIISLFLVPYWNPPAIKTSHNQPSTITQIQFQMHSTFIEGFKIWKFYDAQKTTIFSCEKKKRNLLQPWQTRIIIISPVHKKLIKAWLTYFLFAYHFSDNLSNWWHIVSFYFARIDRGRFNLTFCDGKVHCTWKSTVLKRHVELPHQL